MEAWMGDVPAAGVVSQRVLRANVPDLADRFARLTEQLKDEGDPVLAEQAQGGAIPEIRFADTVVGRVSTKQVARMKRRGCGVIRGVHDPAQVEEWTRKWSATSTGVVIIAAVVIDQFQQRMQQTTRVPGA